MLVCLAEKTQLTGRCSHWCKTVIESGYTFTDMDLESGQKGEWHAEAFRHYGRRSRASVTIVVRTRYNELAVTRR